MACGWFKRDLGGVEALVLLFKRCRVCRSRVILGLLSLRQPVRIMMQVAEHR